ncbi:ZYBA0S05-00716g1_1 [Zygosaccharomyces bailii CLIB 213]|uniref:ZYBA0S05-00716g1_1 n=1 Tax=Zygosaccharomyces bailii (strain CLIB 213 / ATCC 58445 / CBS 680 / BCRC 21525 / NBRC 1098 / NCYC 1416 / NRRL Y-2227) TaxID=1333698 RepID=A0A8J2T7T6_ZYGB2|nr:ZYBA0S05-00716g1_1 [Zygosaccharomyces bailii CLIB 213]
MGDLETIARFLAESVVASTAKNAERNLGVLETEPGFGLNLLHIVASDGLPQSTRLAAALFFKNYVRRRWIDEDGNHLLPQNDTELIKKEIVPLMISLPNNLQIQIGEAISVIADSDFPSAWPTLLNELASRLSSDDMITNKGVLIVAHSIFKRWRPLFRSDELFLEIKMVLEVFTEPFLNLLKAVDEKITQNASNQAELHLLFEVLLLLVKLYYDFNCQDIPEFFEDNIQVGMGILHKYLAYDNPLLDDSDDSENANVLIKVKSSIQELVQLYTTRYEDVFGSLINDFIQITWSLLTSVSPEPKYDILVSKSLSFLTAVARIPKYFEFFNNESAMNNVAEQIILPNVTLRESDIELFEDDPIEYVRRDLEGSDTDTRRRACTDFMKELKEKNEQLITNIFSNHVQKFFELYQSNPVENWRYKDLIVYLFTALAINGNVTSSGVSSTNILLDVVDFFTKQIAPDLTNPVPHIILRVDAIKYIYTFRNQLNKPQLIEILPILAQFLERDEYVVYTYAAITIERILTIRESITSPNFIFSKVDLSNSAEPLLTNLLKLILKQGTSPEKLAENEFLMRAVFRVLQTAEDTIQNLSPQILQELLGIVTIISKNPSNPRFTHYTFESIGAILAYSPLEFLPHIVEAMMPVFLNILSEDIQEFIPYVFQLIAFSVEKGKTVPNSIKQLAQPILSPPLWEMKGNVPAVTRVLKSLIKADQSLFPELVPVLGVFQRLIASKAYDIYGFEILEVIMLYISMDRLKPFLKQIAILLLQRLQNSKTERYVKQLVVFLAIISIKLGPDFVVDFIDGVQTGVFSQIWSNFVLPTLPTIGNLLSRKIALVGILNVMISGQIFANKYPNLLPATLQAIVETASSHSIANLTNDHIDFDNVEEISTFGSSFSRLASVTERPFDPLTDVDLTNGLKAYIATSLHKYNEASGMALFSNLASQLPQEAQVKLKDLMSVA